jgi:hypothetical protein
LAVLLSYLIPDNIAFKIVTLLGTFSLPLTSYLALKIINREIKAEIMAIISLFFFFLNSIAYTVGIYHLPLQVNFPIPLVFLFSGFLLP